MFHLRMSTAAKVSRPKTEGPKGLRGGRVVVYQGKSAKVVSLLTNVHAKIKITETGEEIRVSRKDLSFPKKAPTTKAPAAKKVKSDVVAPKEALQENTKTKGYDSENVTSLLKKCKERGIEVRVGKKNLPKHELIRLLTEQDQLVKKNDGQSTKPTISEQKKPTVLKKKTGPPKEKPAKVVAKKTEKKPDESHKRYFPNQPSLTIIQPKYIILSTLFFPSQYAGREVPDLNELQSAIVAVNREFSTKESDSVVKLAFVNYNSDRDQPAEDVINAEVDADNEHIFLKTAIKELQDSPSGGGGIEIMQLRGELIVLDVKRAHTIPYVQILDTFAKKLGLQRYASKKDNPVSMISFHVPEDGEEDPHATQLIHNVLLLAYAD